MVKFVASPIRMLTRSRSRQLSANSSDSNQSIVPTESHRVKRKRSHSPTVDTKSARPRVAPKLEWTFEMTEFLRVEITSKFPFIGLDPYIVCSGSPECKDKWRQTARKISSKFEVHVTLQDAQLEWYLYKEGYFAKHGEMYTDGLPIDRLRHLYECMKAYEYDVTDKGPNQVSDSIIS
ncbi:hypothetical protein NEOLI_003919 [Neolecta irregularis DAH-3]|uniref:Uncharacterized protein n=1 Tax=Neolecta irregularis (strain DAH-3) TaxID=1198029 RepID=A0A1U7LMI7_NEOID|nr:hypothetical protein NEOLI_003919 [Neolecta irregularis DAH-3]|eukprot:OLL23731.1 hypothetical protein NEOLI_003919 [Neolecta irregularis DAH-3]